MIKKPREIRFIMVLLVTFCGFISCEKYTYNPPTVDETKIWSLQDEIQPIFNSNCVSCHRGTIPPDLREGKSYNSLTSGGYVNLPAESSKLYTKITSSGHLARSTEEEKLMVLYWITQGAKDN